MPKALRRRKVFADWSQNSDYKTTIAVNSLRAKSDRPFMSLPITWEELKQLREEKAADRFCFPPKAAFGTDREGWGSIRSRAHAEADFARVHHGYASESSSRQAQSYEDARRTETTAGRSAPKRAG
jgi:DNA primase